MPGQRQRAREDTWGRLLAPARPVLTPPPALRRSHFPDPPPATLRQQDQPIPLVVPGSLHQCRTAAVVKRTLLDDGEDRRTLSRPGMTPLDTEGSQNRMRRSGRGGVVRLVAARVCARSMPGTSGVHGRSVAVSSLAGRLRRGWL